MLLQESLDILTEFLLEFGHHKVKGIPLDAIQKLARLVSIENVFIYEKIFYPIIIWNIQRYIDDIFFTSTQMLDEANTFHPNIKLVRLVGTSVSFLDVFIKNKSGILATSVYHKDSTETCIVPFRSDHPRHVFNSIIDGALMRAIRYSSTLFAFNEERLLIKLMLLYNGLFFQHLFVRLSSDYNEKAPTSADRVGRKLNEMGMTSRL